MGPFIIDARERVRTVRRAESAVLQGTQHAQERIQAAWATRMQTLRQRQTDAMRERQVAAQRKTEIEIKTYAIDRRALDSNSAGPEPVVSQRGKRKASGDGTQPRDRQRRKTSAIGVGALRPCLRLRTHEGL